MFKMCSWYGFFNVLYREWYVDGRILVVTVTFCIILPLCLLKNLGKFLLLGKMKMPSRVSKKGTPDIVPLMAKMTIQLQ